MPCVEEMGIEEGKEVEAAEEEHEEEAKVEAKEEPKLMADAVHALGRFNLPVFSISVVVSSVARRPLRKRMRRKVNLLPSRPKCQQGRTVCKSHALGAGCTCGITSLLSF